MIAACRVVALLVAIPTFVLLIVADRWTLNHLFFIPDLMLCAGLAAAALLPHRHARRGLILAFAFAGGVITTAVCSYIARDALDEGIATLIAAVTCLAACSALTFTRRSNRIGDPPVSPAPRHDD